MNEQLPGAFLNAPRGEGTKALSLATSRWAHLWVCRRTVIHFPRGFPEMSGLRRFWGNRRARAGIVLVFGLVMLALVGPFFVMDPSDFLGNPLEPPSSRHWLGTTRQGQDVLAQTVVGARTSLLLGILVGAITVALGGAVGLIAGTRAGLVDETLSLATNIFLILPGLPLSVVLAAYLEASPFSIAVVLIFTGWAWNARVIRAQAQSLAQKDYVEAAVVAGESRFRILFAEILPNMLSVVASCFVGAVIHSLGAQVGLEFLGLGDVSQITWGTNLYWAANNQALLTESWWTIVPTGLLIALTGLGLGLVQFGIDELMNPRLKQNFAYERILRHAGLAPSPDTPVLFAPRAAAPQKAELR
jgi:peptide/nickel transport system permease protein